MRLAHVPDVLADNPAPRAAEDVADEKNVQCCPMLLKKGFSGQVSGFRKPPGTHKRVSS